MTLDVWFWLFFVLYAVFGIWRDYETPGPWYRWGGAHLFTLIMLFIIGLRIFGSPVK